MGYKELILELLQQIEDERYLQYIYVLLCIFLDDTYY